MEKKVSIPYHLTAGPGAEGFETIYTVLGGKRLKVTLVHIAFPIDTTGKLGVALYYGLRKVYPKDGLIRGDNMTWVDEVKLEWGSGDPVKLYYKNDDTATSKEAYVKLEGILE